jgi:DNA invertase Pin-like site-specific DNA recombinase
MTSTGEPIVRPKAYSYVRFSTPEQAKGDSLRRQTEDARAYAARNKLTLDDELNLKDEGVSAFYGKNAQTGALGAFLDFVHNGVVPQGSYLIVESLDRISRQTVRKAVRTLEDIVEAGINLVDLSDGGKVYNVETLESDQMSFLLMAIRFMRANEESERKRDRGEKVYAQKRKDAATTGKLFTKTLPAWLRWNADKAKIEIISARARLVSDMFRKANEGWSRHRIANWLNTRGIETWGSKKNKAPFWRANYIKKILTSAAVIGTFTPHKMIRSPAGKRRKPLDPIANYFPAVVDAELFESVSARLKSTAARGRNASAEPRYIFAGIMKCGFCGSTVTRVTKGGYVYCVCTKAHARAGCQYQAVRYQDLEQRLREVADWIIDNTPRGQNTAELERKIDNLSAGVDAALDQERDFAYLWQIEKSEAARLRWHEITVEREKKEEELRDLRAQVDRLASRTVVRKLEALRTALKTEPFDVVATNKALRQATDRIVLNPEQGSLTIYWQHAEEPSWPIVFGGRHMKWESLGCSE